MKSRIETVVCTAVILWSWVQPVTAFESRQVIGGRATFFPSSEVLAELGISFSSDSMKPSSPIGEHSWRLTSGEVTKDTLLSGLIVGANELTLETSRTTVTFPGFVLRTQTDLTQTSKQGSAEWILTPLQYENGGPALTLDNAKANLDLEQSAFRMEIADVRISAELAALLERPQAAGASIGSLRIAVEMTPGALGSRSVFENADAANLGEGGTRGGTSGTNCWNPGEPLIGPDVIVGDLMDLSNYASSGGIEAFAVGTYSCNIGSSDLLWIDSNNQHPVIGQSMYRLKNGRFEHVGQSWLKHGFLALSDNICGCGCSGSGGSVLNVGCADPYCCGLNGQQGNLGPKYQVNSFTGAYTYPPANPGFSGSVARRLQVRISDLDPTQNGGGQYFVEGQYVTGDDAFWGNQANNASYRAVNITGAGASWSASLAGSTVRESPAIRAWQDNDPTVIETNVPIPGEVHVVGQAPRNGLMILSSKATDLGGGQWHYEYAVQNVTSDRSAGSFSVPLRLNTTVSNVEFHDVDYHSGEAFDGTDWTPTVTTSSVTWATAAHSVNPNANALRWGTLYNFRFDANQAPESIQVTIGLFKPGTAGSPNSVLASATGPGGQLDCNNNLIADECDLSCGAPSGPCDVPGCGLSADCDDNTVPDDCQADCNANSIADTCDLTNGTSQDCNSNQTPDECDSFPTVPLATVRVASGLSSPVYVNSPPGDTARLFIVEQTGAIKILNLGSGTVNGTPYLNISGLISTGGERGLLGMAFHPDYATNGHFFVNYTNTSGNTVIARYTVSGDPNVANPASAVILKTIVQDFSNHNGGCLQFGPDEMMYVGMGDGGSGNDPLGRGQSTSTLLGKMLRLDVDNPPTYVPGDNPFVGPGNPLDEIWAIGKRNPWRFSFDRLTGDMYIGDVGQNAREEINFQPASSTGGENYGWRCMEGFQCTGLSGCTCNSPALTLPILDYAHNIPNAPCYSITGGYVYRGCAIPSLSGTYFYSDYCVDFVRSFRYDGVTLTEQMDRTVELAPPPGQGTLAGISSFGEDANGELYIVTLPGNIYKIVPDVVVPVCGNGVVEAGEECDDSNTTNGDGCDSNCQVEAGTDACADAPVLCPGSRLGTTDSTTNDGDATCDGAGATPDVWYVYTPEANGMLTVSTCSSANYDTVLSIHSACPGTTANELGCDNDGCGTSRSSLTIPVVLGTPYYIRVSGLSGDTGDYTITLSGPDCLVCPQVLFEDHFNTDLGWTVQNTSLTDGAWNRGDPVGDGTRGDPTDDYDGGGQAYLTDNTAGNSDVDGGPTRLISPVIDASVGNVTLSYAYWFMRDDAEGTDSLEVEVSTDGGTIWTPLAEYDVGIQAWITASLLLDDFVTPTATTRLRFSVTDNPNNSVIEAGVDAVLMTIPCPGDCNGNGVPDATDITKGTSEDCNDNNIPDECDLGTGTSSDCDGGPVGSIDGGDDIVNAFCFGCHNTDGSGGPGYPGPNIRNKSRVEIADMLLPPTTHPGGAFGGFTPQDFADLEAFLADGGSRGRPNGIPDECDAVSPGLADCDSDLAYDGCELEAATQADLNFDGAPDSCSPPICPSPVATAAGSRYILLSAPAGTGRMALKILGDAGDPDIACVSAYVQPDETLGATSVARTPAAWGSLVVNGVEIRPSSDYSVLAECLWGTSAPTPVSTSVWGDVNNTAIVDVDDIVCILDGFSGVFVNCSADALDLWPCDPNELIDVDDILQVLDAFAQLPFPCSPPCP